MAEVMNASEWSSLVESFSREAYADGFSPKEGVKLLMWWMHAPMDEAWAALQMHMVANCIETDTQEMP